MPVVIPKSWQSKITPDITKCLLGDKITAGWEPLSWSVDLFIMWMPSFFWPRGMRDLSSLTRDRTCAHCSGSTDSYPLNHQGSLCECPLNLKKWQYGLVKSKIKSHSKWMCEQTKIFKWNKFSFPSDSARRETTLWCTWELSRLFGVHENYLESFVQNTDFQSSSLQNVINMITKTEVGLGIVFFSKKAVRNLIFEIYCSIVN